MYYRPGLTSADFGASIRGVPNDRVHRSEVRNVPANGRAVAVSRTLIPVKLMDGAARAIAYFVDSNYCQPGAEVHLLNVQRLSMKGDFALDAAPHIECRAKLAIGTEVLNHARAPLDAKSITCKTTVLFGDPADTIAHYAREHRIDAIIMETERVHPLSRLLFRGSVSAKVVRLANADVTLVSRAEGPADFSGRNSGMLHVPRVVN